VEWADKNGADIINSSLGYGGQRYSYKDMNGTQTLVSRAGNLAAKKGILVVNSAGNEGNGRWNFINAPADADSVLAVGGIHPFSGIQTPFSSVGPTFNNKFKPNVTAIAHVMAAQDDYIVETQGTSFSSPLVAGFAACVWQVNSDWNNMELFKALENGSDLYPYHDYAHGFGVPKAENFIGHLIDSLPTKIPEVVLDSLLDSDSLIITNSIQELDTTFMFSIESGELKFTIIQPSSIERTVSNFWAFDIDNEELKAAVDYEDYLFIHFRDKTGHITHYQVIDMLGAEEVFVDIPYNTAVIMCSYEGHSQLINYNP